MTLVSPGVKCSGVECSAVCRLNYDPPENYSLEKVMGFMKNRQPRKTLHLQYTRGGHIHFLIMPLIWMINSITADLLSRTEELSLSRRNSSSSATPAFWR